MASGPRPQALPVPDLSVFPRTGPRGVNVSTSRLLDSFEQTNQTLFRATSMISRPFGLSTHRCGVSMPLRDGRLQGRVNLRRFLICDSGLEGLLMRVCRYGEAVVAFSRGSSSEINRIGNRAIESSCQNGDLRELRRARGWSRETTVAPPSLSQMAFGREPPHALTKLLETKYLPS